jgi:hypothetical protein
LKRIGANDAVRTIKKVLDEAVIFPGLPGFFFEQGKMILYGKFRGSNFYKVEYLLCCE